MSGDSTAPRGSADVLTADDSGWAFDLVLVAVLSVVTAALVWQGAAPRVLVWILGVPFLLFYPGYGVIAAVFPDRPERVGATAVTPGGPPSRLARAALSLAVSPILVAAVATVLSPLEAIELGPVLAGVTFVTLAALAVAGVRRLQLPVHLRDGLSASGVRSAFAVGLPGNSLQSVALVVGLIALVGVSIAAVAVPPSGEAYTEAYLLTEDDGEFVADGLPEDPAAGETAQFHVGITNNENEPVEYEAVTVLQEVDADGEVATQSRADSFSVRLADGEEAIERQSFTTEETGEGDRLRVQVLLYESEVPEEPTAGSADHVLQFYLSGGD